MSIKERIKKYFAEKSTFRISSDLVFYLLILSMLLPFSRKYVATGLNKAVMHRPSIINENRQLTLSDDDYNWKLVDMRGETVSFSSFRGEVVFLNIWATWCPPCRAEMPNIQRLYNEYGDRISMVLASQEDPLKVKQFLDDKGYDLPVYRLVQNLPEKLMTSSIPTSFLINREGRITVKKTGSARWDGKFFTSHLEETLKGY
ncbi:TlpA family protein disulfide reductase [Bacteroidota bacterium]